MNRIKGPLAVLLAILFLLSACSEAAEEISEIISDEISEESTAYVPQNKTVISVGKPYKTYTAASANYADLDGKQLTDGYKAPDVNTGFVDSRLVGYNANGHFVIDLGEDGKNIISLSARSLELYEAGIGLAASVKFSGSNDNKKWTSLGNAKFVAEGNKTVVTATLDLESPVDYRYIMVRISRGVGATFFFIDEIEIFADVPDRSSDSLLLAYRDADLKKDERKNLSTNKKAEYINAFNVAENKKYNYTDCEIDKRAPAGGEYLQDDLRTFLTNGVPTGMTQRDNVWVGMSGKDGKKPSVTVDLARVYDNIFGFRVNSFGAAADIGFADYVDYYGSENGIDFYFIGRVYAPISGTNFAYPLYLDEFLKLRYVRFEFGGSGPFWVEEVEILAGLGEGDIGEIYPQLDLPVVTEELLWDKTEPDYNKRQNLISGLKHHVSTSFFASANKITDHRVLASVNTACLTDGKRASSLDKIDNGEWFFAPNNHGEVNVFYDIGKLSAVDTIVFDFMERAEWGILSPDNVDIYLSENGEDWYKVGDQDALGTRSHTGSFMEYEFKLDKTYAARFVRFRIECNGWMLIDELSVFGKKAVSNATARLSDSGINSVKFYTNYKNAKYASVEGNPIKANDINLIYLRKDLETKRDKDFLLPMVAYLDEKGNIKDTFLDGFLYLPSSPLPSGIAPHLETIKSDWDWLFEATFHGVSGFDRLDEIVGEVKEALDIPDYKVQVYATILTVLETQTNFGDVDGDGVSENCYYAEDREKVVRWYVGKCLSEFEKGNYENIEFGGFYWMHEEVVDSEQGEAIIAQTADIVHDMGSYFIWIPYYNAPRYYIGEDMGFDLVNMQANMVFNLRTPKWQIDSAAMLTKLRGMAVEMEHTWQATYDIRYAQRYLDYLYNGYIYGYHETVNIFYDDGGNFYSMGIKDDLLCRLQYDATYHYVKGDLNYNPKARDVVSLEAKKNEILYAKLESDTLFTRFSIASMPENGCVSVSEDGSFAYYPDKDFTGTDSFTYTYNNLVGESEECVVEITVK